MVWDWNIKGQVYLLDEIERLKELLITEDADLKKTNEAEEAEKMGYIRFGALPEEAGRFWRGLAGKHG